MTYVLGERSRSLRLNFETSFLRPVARTYHGDDTRS